MKTVILKPGRSTPFINRHPWLFSGAIGKVTGNPEAGDWVKVTDDKAHFIAYGLFNPHSQIRVRLYAFDEQAIPDNNFWHLALQKAIDLRVKTLGENFQKDNACRLINSEGDGLPGLTVDRYGDYLSLQFTSLAVYAYKDLILKSLVELVNPKGIILRTEQKILAEEGLELKDGLVWGNLPEEPIVIKENGICFEINLASGQKTGFYLDQKANRIAVESFAKGREVLDLCSYTGGFALHAAQAGASKVTAVDVSAHALQLAERNAKINNLSNIEFIKSDMFKYLDKCMAEGKNYDLIILDPPKMTHSKGSVSNALSGYLQLNASAMKSLKPNGVLFTCSCSGRVSKDDFLFMMHKASMIANKQLRILEVRGADTDHPISPACPESEYLKCFVCGVG